MLRRVLSSTIKSHHFITPLKALQVRHFGVRHKVVDLEDAINIVKSGDTLVISGFVAQSSPEALLRALGEHYEKTKSPKNLRILFGGGPGDWDKRGINHLAHSGMIDVSIGAHYGQVPMIAKKVLDNEFAGYAIPMGAFSRIVRAAAGKSPGYITKVGLSTFVDPANIGGALNEKASKVPIVERIKLDNQDYLRYFPININVAFIRATTADPEGNLTLEHESILGDVKVIAMATRSSGGIVVAQVERLAEVGSIPSREVSIPGTFVDCVVVTEREDEHHLSYFTKKNPVWTGEIREPADSIEAMPMSPRKVIARRAAMELKADDVVNLGIGIPEGVASIASEEGIFQYVTLTTEAGTIGGVGAGGHDFGPAKNPQAFNEMNQQFDLYNGGGLSVAFLGLAECGGKGDVNVSRLSKDRLTGPGGFIDIASCTHRVNFLGTFTKQGCKLALDKDAKTGKHKLVIKKEGQIKTFQKAVQEVTFAASEAIASGQQVLFITERAVFELVPNGLRLIEIAPGVDLQKDILDQMDIVPEYTLPVKLMDQRIFEDEHMELYTDMFDMCKLVDTRVSYEKESNVVFLNLQNFIVVNEEDIEEFESFLEKKYQSFMQMNGGKKMNVVVNYDGFDCKAQLVDKWTKMAQKFQSQYYNEIRRYGGHVFMRKKIGTELKCESDEEYWKEMTNGRDVLTRKDLAALLAQKLYLPATQELMNHLMGKEASIRRCEFSAVMDKLREYREKKRLPVDGN